MTALGDGLQDGAGWPLPVPGSGIDGSGVLEWFRLQGVVDGLPVRASWEHGVFDCDPDLLRRGELAREVDEAFDRVGHRWPAEPPVLGSPPIGPAERTLLTLTRACDRVVKVEFAVLR
jgi:hypothetical protein